MADLKKALGERIKKCRLEKGMTLRELGSQVGMTSSALSKVEKGSVSITSENLFAISEAFGVSVDWLLTGKEAQFKDEGYDTNEVRKEATPIFFDEEWEVVSQFRNLSDEEKTFVKQYLRFTQAQKKDQQSSEDEKEDTIREEAAGYAIDTNSADEYTGSAPIWGEAAAGIPIESIRMYEGKRLRVPAKYNKCFAVKVKGDSMKDSGILNGGYVIVRSQNMVDDDDIALMMIENQATIKRFHLRGNDVVLISDNDDFEPMVFHRSKEMQVVGKVVYYIRPEEAEIIEEWSE
ncbi:DNA-binding helix-turn-helix protein [Paenibacillus sp. oral taxon 786 str. D14]|uniref:helix-turn-helix domain-containing protein n=1 Tax=Paenibacillus sp. oral taxon 786 TaxID=652715 RepID=UPI0001AFCDDB|nr:XRE family transcriptional regulator [Paenibacillus sp. oral taxon 786]EES74623.1 DNA-binding helix-turn-helix protein [Paenibacillus sp. oral taxon 786 str. D14]